MTTAKSEPLATVERLEDSRKVTLALSNCPRFADRQGNLFMPDTLKLEWWNGFLTGCELSGRVLRADGASHLDDRRTGVNWHVGITEDAPDWALRLILQHRP